VAGLLQLDAPGYDPFGPLGANFNLLIGSTAVDPVSGTAPPGLISARSDAPRLSERTDRFGEPSAWQFPAGGFGREATFPAGRADLARRDPLTSL
jgi:hypothetical protein